MPDKSARQRILDTMTGRERISDDFIPLVRARDLDELMREHEAQDKAIREALVALRKELGSHLAEHSGAIRILSSVLEQTPEGSNPCRVWKRDVGD